MSDKFQFPPDDTMHALHALCQAAGVSTENGIIEAGIVDDEQPDGFRRVEITGERLDELVAREWVVYPSADEIAVTDTGVYRCRQWAAQKDRAARKSRRPAGRSTRNPFAGGR